MNKAFFFYNIFISAYLKYFYFFKEKFFYFFCKKKLKKILSNKRPLVSIILPTFNRSAMLESRSIRSVLKQSYKNFELLVISDGCTDNTDEVIRDFNDPRIKLYKILRNKKRYPETALNHWLMGPAYAINEGLSNIKGDWIARIDDDDIWAKDHLKTSLDLLYQSKCEFVSNPRLQLSDGKFKIVHSPSVWPYNKKYKVLLGSVSSWIYASYLSFVKVNVNSWRKNNNRINDIDLLERILNLNVRTCYKKKATLIGLPRKKNSLVGSKYYIHNEQEILDKYNIEK